MTGFRRDIIHRSGEAGRNVVRVLVCCEGEVAPRLGGGWNWLRGLRWWCNGASGTWGMTALWPPMASNCCPSNGRSGAGNGCTAWGGATGWATGVESPNQFRIVFPIVVIGLQEKKLKLLYKIFKIDLLLWYDLVSSYYQTMNQKH